MDRLMRFEKTSKYVEAVDAYHYTCITSTTTTTTTTVYVPVKAATKGLLPENRLEIWYVTLSLNMIMGMIEMCPILLNFLSNVVHSIFYHSMMRFWTVIFLPTMHLRILIEFGTTSLAQRQMFGEYVKGLLRRKLLHDKIFLIQLLDRINSQTVGEMRFAKRNITRLQLSAIIILYSRMIISSQWTCKLDK